MDTVNINILFSREVKRLHGKQDPKKAILADFQNVQVLIPIFM